LAGAAITAMPRILGSSKTVVARNLVETLNTSVHRFNQTNYELVVAVAGTSGDDELLVLRTLQYRDSGNPAMGSPYMRTDWNPVVSSSTLDYRIVWAGSLYRLVEPGAAGTGLKVNFEGTDLGTPYVFPTGFTMAGK
jgi:hypothetical protein